MADEELDREKDDDAGTTDADAEETKPAAVQPRASSSAWLHHERLPSGVRRRSVVPSFDTPFRRALVGRLAGEL